MNLYEFIKFLNDNPRALAAFLLGCLGIGMWLGHLHNLWEGRK